MKTIIWYGLRRNGNHGIINLILKSCVNYVHINDVKLSYSEYLKFRDVDNNQNIISDNIYVGFKNIDVIVISMEDKKIKFNEIKRFSNIENLYKCILIRNPYNFLASIIKTLPGDPPLKHEKNVKFVQEYIKLWKLYAETFLDESEDFIYILYDKFYTDLEYRKHILNLLNIDYEIVKEYLDDKPGYAYSSWNENEVDFNRFLYYKNDPYFDNYVFKDKKIFYFWKSIVKRNNLEMSKELLECINGIKN